MAMIIVALVATLSVSMVWQQWRAVQVESAERARSQSAWVLAGALDWSRIILKEDARTGGPDHLGEPWAVPLAEARLSTFLAADKENTDGGPEAFLAGSITDAQARYNLRNLLGNNGIDPDQLKVLQRLCNLVGVTPDAAMNIATGLRDAMATTGQQPSPSGGAPQGGSPAPPGGVMGTPPTGGMPNPTGAPPQTGAGATPSNLPDGPLMPLRVEQLRWLGVAPEVLRRLEPYIVLLPNPTAVNANTAPREVLAATIQGLDISGAERLVQVRQRSPFRSMQDISGQVPGLTLNQAQIDFKSNFFVVRGRLRVGDAVLEQRSLVERRGSRSSDIVALTREWITTRDDGAPK
jgi:general secretion pathway protein K